MSSYIESCSAGYLLTKAHVLEACRQHYRSKVRRSLVVAMKFTAVLLSTVSVLILLTDRSRPAANACAITFLGITLFWFFLKQRATDWWLGRPFDRSPAANLPIEWTFSQDRVLCRCGDLGSSTFEWTLLTKLVETKAGFLTYQYPGSAFHWVPFSAFKSPEGTARLRQFVQDHQIPTVRVSR